jgi:hypothetical protein
MENDNDDGPGVCQSALQLSAIVEVCDDDVESVSHWSVSRDQCGE